VQACSAALDFRGHRSDAEDLLVDCGPGDLLLGDGRVAKGRGGDVPPAASRPRAQGTENLLLGGARETRRRAGREKGIEKRLRLLFSFAWSTGFQDDAGRTTYKDLVRFI
jgi:hypothetical protein